MLENSGVARWKRYRSFLQLNDRIVNTNIDRAALSVNDLDFFMDMGFKRWSTHHLETFENENFQIQEFQGTYSWLTDSFALFLFIIAKIVQEKTFSQPIIVSSAFCGIVFKKRVLFMNYYDQHLHTFLSFDSDEQFENYLAYQPAYFVATDHFDLKNPIRDSVMTFLTMNY